MMHIAANRYTPSKTFASPGCQSGVRSTRVLATRTKVCNSANAARRGISLLEILFSVFILSVGLLGLAALIPVGGADVGEATKADRGSTAGRATFREAKVRRMFDHRMWMNHLVSDDPAFPQTWWDLDHVDETPVSPVDEGHSICIDPLFIARNLPFLPADQDEAIVWPGRSFPYMLDNDPMGAKGLNTNDFTNPVGLLPPRMSRVTLRSWPSTYAPMMSLGLAERIFRWQDDLTFDSPLDDTLRPTAVVDSLGRGLSDGNYTWMATLTPEESGETAAANRRLYNYSIIVFYKRNLDAPVPDQTVTGGAPPAWQLAERTPQPPTERVVLADFLTPGVSLGGGDVRLRLLVNDDDDNDVDDEEKSDFTKIRAGNWILLSGYQVKPSWMSADEEWHRSVFQWYRIIAVSDGPELWDKTRTESGQKEWIRDVTLSGPDWVSTNSQGTKVLQDIDGKTNYETSYATLVEGVVAVYTKTIELDTMSGW